MLKKPNETQQEKIRRGILLLHLFIIGGFVWRREQHTVWRRV